MSHADDAVGAPVPIASDDRPDQVPVVGIGASAGGLDAITLLFRALPADTGMGFVLIQHLDPLRESKLAEIVGRLTAMPVREIQDKLRVEADHVYIIPPNSSVVISKGILEIAAREDAPAPHFLINRFLCSLAEDAGRQAVAVILSGSGADGAEGLKAVKAAGGIAFVQAENTAKYTGMPVSAAATGAADFILPPAEIAAELARISKDPSALRQSVEDPRLADNSEALIKIFTALRKATKVDFEDYKQSTVQRRIGRRMVVHKIGSFADYARYLDAHPAEVMELYRDILIHVTSFFREPASFDVLMKHLADQVRSRERGQTIRVWVAGCATGEEVYSIAICMDELLGNRDRRVPVQLFGTDISEKSLQRARKGIYPESITADVSPERLTRYFSKVDSGFQVIKSIREACIFARHDLLRDAPFSKLDLISCRNVLIYMGPVLQRRILPLFHYGLNPSGLLMLGTAEAVPGASDLFLPVDKEYKIYKKNPAATRPSMEVAAGKPMPLRSIAAPPDLQTRVNQVLKEKSVVDGVVIRRDMQIVSFHGHTGSYLDPAAGTANLNLLRMIRDELVFKIQALVLAAIEQNQPVRNRDIRLSLEVDSTVGVEVIPLPAQNTEELFLLVLFEAAKKAAGDAASPLATPQVATAKGLRLRINDLERELADARTNLRTVSEDHEANVEELRAANEEVRSTNEELQSSNEELGTAKEELQSVNEELRTINEELQVKNADLGLLNDDLKNLFSTANLPVIMIGNDLRVRRFTPAAETLLNLIPADVGRLIADLRGIVDLPSLIDMLRRAIDDLAITQVDIRIGKRWHSVSCRPYRTTDNRIEGAVISFADIHPLKQSLQAAQSARDYAEGIIDTIWEPLVVLDSDLRVQRAGSGFYRAFQVTPEETEGRLIYELGNRQWNIPKLRGLLEDILSRNSSFHNFEVTHQFHHIGLRHMRLNGRRIPRGDDRSPLILLAIDDVTDRQQAAEVRYHRLFESAKDGILILDAKRDDVIDVNPYFLELCACPRNEVIGKKLWETGLFAAHIQLKYLMAELRRTDMVRLDNIRLVSRDGRQIDAELLANCYRVGDEEVIQCNFRDITSRKQAETDLRRSNEDLEQFAYAASHDLQEPLRSVRSFSQLIATKYEPLLDEEGRQFLGFIQSGAERMSELIRDLLAYSQIHAHQMLPESVGAETVLAWTVMNLQMAISDSHALITNDGLPRVKIDRTLFIQVMQNLIGNALKYRKPGVRPHIHVSAVREGHQWIFSVRDNGLGFNPDAASKVFGVFKRLHGKEYPGTGIGLSICKKIIERNGGRIWAESTLGEGSTFYFTVPDEKAPAAVAPDSEEPGQTTDVP